MRELKSIEEKILDRALYLFGKNGSTSVPIRAISKEANVNVSAINYYFRSKDEMIANVKEFYIENIIAAYSALDNDDISDEEKVILCANEIMEYELRYPGVLVINKEAVNAEFKDEMDTKIINITNNMNGKLDEVLGRVLKSSKDDFEYNRMIFLAAILQPTSDMYIGCFNKKNIYEKEWRIKYIRYMLSKLK